jgi:hypothetical protein
LDLMPARLNFLQSDLDLFKRDLDLTACNIKFSPNDLDLFSCYSDLFPCYLDLFPCYLDLAKRHSYPSLNCAASGGVLAGCRFGRLARSVGVWSWAGGVLARSVGGAVSGRPGSGRPRGRLVSGWCRASRLDRWRPGGRLVRDWAVSAGCRLGRLGSF